MKIISLMVDHWVQKDHLELLPLQTCWVLLELAAHLMEQDQMAFRVD